MAWELQPMKWCLLIFRVVFPSVKRLWKHPDRDRHTQRYVSNISNPDQLVKEINHHSAFVFNEHQTSWGRISFSLLLCHTLSFTPMRWNRKTSAICKIRKKAAARKQASQHLDFGRHSLSMKCMFLLLPPRLQCTVTADQLRHSTS